MALTPWCVLVLVGSLAAQGAPELPNPATTQAPRERQPASTVPGAPLATVAAGFYSQSVSNHFGLWQGLVLDATWDPWKNGKFIASLISADRPMGSGVVGSIGKYQEFKGGYGFLGVATSKGADYLPTFQVVSDLNVDLPMTGLVLGGGYIYTRVRDLHENHQLSLGPTFYFGNFISTVRLSLNRSNPGSQDSTSTTVTVRQGAQDYRAWQSFRLTWGGEAYQNLLLHEAVTARGAGAGLDCFFPLAHAWTLQTGLEWGQKNGAYRLWGGSVRVGRMFR